MSSRVPLAQRKRGPCQRFLFSQTEQRAESAQLPRWDEFSARLLSLNQLKSLITTWAQDLRRSSAWGLGGLDEAVTLSCTTSLTP